MDTDPLPMHGQSQILVGSSKGVRAATAEEVAERIRSFRPEIGFTIAPLSWALRRLAFAKLGIHVGPLQIWLDW